MADVYINKYCILTKKSWNISSFPDVTAVSNAQENYNAIYGVNDSYYPAPYKGHIGTDYLTPTGSPLYGLDGFVVGNINHISSGLGNHISIENGRIAFVAAHLDNITVSVGQSLDSNTIIGYTGNTGYSQGPHLHVQTWLTDVNIWVDSTPYMSGEWDIPFPENHEITPAPGAETPTPNIEQGIGFSANGETVTNIYDETGTYHFTKDNNNPVYHSLEDAFFDRNSVAVYTNGESVQYKKVVDTNGYRYIAYVGSSGNTCYIAVRNHSSGWRAGYAE